MKRILIWSWIYYWGFVFCFLLFSVKYRVWNIFFKSSELITLFRSSTFLFLPIALSEIKKKYNSFLTTILILSISPWIANILLLYVLMQHYCPDESLLSVIQSLWVTTFVKAKWGFQFSNHREKMVWFPFLFKSIPNNKEKLKPKFHLSWNQKTSTAPNNIAVCEKGAWMDDAKWCSSDRKVDLTYSRGETEEKQVTFPGWEPESLRN